MKFKFTADVTFDADDLDGAFASLSEHFDALGGDEEATTMLFEGCMDLHRETPQSTKEPV